MGESNTLGLREERVFNFLDKIVDVINEIQDSLKEKKQIKK